jgi:two-component system, cell cycle sensor histidine kinase and response regulator CckA
MEMFQAMPDPVLLVEDDSVLRELLSRVLTSAGYEVFAAKDSTQALQIFAREQQASFILLTDVMLPGMNGHELAKGILRIRPATKVGFMSGWFDPDLIKLGMCGQCWCILNKPFENAALLRFVESIASRGACQGLADEPFGDLQRYLERERA